MNKVILMGRLTADPELHTTQGGVYVATFMVAVDRRFKNPDGTRTADFIRCVAWRRAAEFIADNFGKGRMIGVVGTIQSRTYTDSEGTVKKSVEVRCDEVYFTGETRREDTRPAAPPEREDRGAGFDDVMPPDEYEQEEL